MSSQDKFKELQRKNYFYGHFEMTYFFVTWRHCFSLLEEQESSIQIFLKTRCLELGQVPLFSTICTNLEDLVHFYSETVGSHTSSDRNSLHVAMQRRKALGRAETIRWL